MTEYLLEVINHIVIGCRGITHHKIHRLLLGYFNNGRFIYITVEASHEITFIHDVDLLTGYLLGFYFSLQFNTEVEHHLEEQVFVTSVCLYVFIEEGTHAELLRSVIHLFHIRGIEFQDPETSIEVLTL